MRRLGSWLGAAAILAAIVYVGFTVSNAASLPSAGLMGSVKSADGKMLEGVAISARSTKQTFTTSVFSNREGEYYFPELASGQYQVWAQAVGFEASRTEKAVAGGSKVLQNFTLKPTPNFHNQLSSTEWSESMPDATPEDARMKRILTYNCSNCHLKGFILAKRFDSTGWGIILNTMLNDQAGADTPAGKLMQVYKEELATYLTKIRGPKPFDWNWKIQPRASGPTTEIVVTEYDISRGESPNYLMSHNGTDWAEGIPSNYEGEAFHDAVAGKDGFVYFSDNITPLRTIGRLDPQTGMVKGYMLADSKGDAVRTHGAVVVPNGDVFFTNGSEGTLLKFDTKTEQFQRFPKPATMARGIGGTIAVDSKGTLWATFANGAVRLDPQTGQYTEFKAVTPGGNPYGITVDSQDNAWFAQLQADRVGFVNGRTGEVGEVVVPPLEDKLSPKDEEIASRLGRNGVGPLQQKGPRRLAADKHGDAVWVAEYWAGRLLKIDINTRKLTEYPLPSAQAHPYAVAVDKNHRVWVNQMNSDRVAMFNPSTEKFTEYPFPSIGTETRFIDVDNSTELPTIWLPYYRTNKLSRIQMRSPAAYGEVAPQQARY